MATKANGNRKSGAPRSGTQAQTGGSRPAAPHRHWRTETDADGIVWLHFDKADSGTNVLSGEVLEELDRLIDTIDRDKPKGLVILSDKAGGFVAGADVKEFTTLQDTAAAMTLIQRGQSIFTRLEALDVPSVALIHGFCLGGGLELALACRYRLADADARTRLGLPEIRLGIHPGFGGTVRLTRLIGAPAAMDMMLTGRSISARAAKKRGVVDLAVPSRHLKTAARSLILNAPAPHRPGRLPALTNHRLVRPALAWYLKRQTAAKASPQHYPAPYALIELWSRHADNPTTMLAEEAASVAKLITGYTAQNLIRVFFLQEKLKSLGKPVEKAIKPGFARVHVIGGGVMGGDIAAWCALQGLTVSIQDQQHESLAKAMQRAHDLFKKRVKERRLVQAAMDRLMPDLKGAGLGRADVVIEAIFEDLKAKQNLFRGIESRLKPGVLLATNTSSIPLEDLGKALKRPDRLVGLHFFNPVAKMQLVEIVAGTATSARAAQSAAAFTRLIHRLPLPVKSGPGFLVNRILMPYLIEAVTLEEEGVPAAVIDKAAVDFGMPMGPISLADTVGLDICLSVAKNLAKSLGAPVPERLRTLVEAGALGRKSGRGFYSYRGRKPHKPKPRKDYKPPKDLIDRLMLRMLNEAVVCLREGVVADGDLLDAGIIFGTGFAPFRGGPMHYIEHTGPDRLSARLGELASAHGPRFNVDVGWKDLQGKE